MNDETRGEQPDPGLLLRFDLHTVEHLGSNMYSRLPNAIAELVANAFDADATQISVQVLGKGSYQSICVNDNGHGMSRQDLQEKYLRIGRNRRGSAATARSESGRRIVSGKKGLGKLALFGIGHQVEVATKRFGSKNRLIITLDWDALLSTESGDYSPELRIEEAPGSEHGTSVKVSRLTRVSDISPEELSESLSRLFQYTDSELSLDVVGRDGIRIPVTRQLRLGSIDTEFRWNIPADLTDCAAALAASGVEGVVIAAHKPLPTQMRGVAVYSNGRLVNEPEFFGASDSSYAYAYLAGYISVDALDAIKPDVVATDRRAVNWDQADAALIRLALKRMVEEVALLRRQRRAVKKDAQIQHETGVDPDEWVDSVQGPEKEPLRELISIIASEDTDMSDEDRGKAVKSLKDIAPPYADLVWRHLHPSIQMAGGSYFKDGDYYQALLEACKQYVADLRAAARRPGDSEASLFGTALGAGGGRLNFTGAFRSGNPRISEQSAENLENGQRELAKAMWAAFRNPLSHETVETIKALGVISHQDCLDALSLMSHLRRRLDSMTPT